MIKIMAVAFVIVICGAAASHTLGQERSAPRTPPIHVISYGGDMASLLAVLPENFGGVPVGLETDPKQPTSYVSIRVETRSITDVLNAIVKSAPRYQWRERDGCMEVLPVEKSSPFLDTIVNNFEVTETDDKTAINSLLNLPDVQANLRAIGLKRKVANSASTETRGGKFSLKLEGLTMRQTLCRIAKESRSRFWIFQTFAGGVFSINTSPR